MRLLYIHHTFSFSCRSGAASGFHCSLLRPAQQVAGPRALRRIPESCVWREERGGEADLTVLPSISSHFSGACCCKLTPCSTYQSCSGGLFERKRMVLFKAFFCFVSLRQCAAEEEKRTELIMRLDFTAVHATALH